MKRIERACHRVLVLLASLFWSVIMKRSLIPLISMGAIFLVLVGACLVILLQKGKCFNIFFLVGKQISENKGE